MAKLRDRKKLQWCLRQFEQGKATQTWLANYLRVTPRRFKQIYRIYKKTKTAPQIGLNVGRPKTKISKQHKQIILEQWAKHHFNALYLENIIEQEQKKKIPHNTIPYIESCLNTAWPASRKANRNVENHGSAMNVTIRCQLCIWIGM